MTTQIKNNKKFGNRFQWPASSIGVWLVLATFGGTTWSVLIEVNDDGHPSVTGTDHWFPWMSVDAGGKARIAWSDRRLRTDLNPDWTDVFVGSFIGTASNGPNVRITDRSFPMNISSNIRPIWGEYNGAYATANRFYVAWGDGRNCDPDAFAGGLVLTGTAPAR